jgi:hypothetical protein
VVRLRSLAAWISFSVSIPSPELSSTLPVLRRPAAPPGRLSWLSDRVRRWSSCSAAWWERKQKDVKIVMLSP